MNVSFQGVRQEVIVTVVTNYLESFIDYRYWTESIFLFLFSGFCLHGGAPAYLAETLHLTSDVESHHRIRFGSTLTLLLPSVQ